MSENKNNGAGWIKQGKNGKYISCQIEIDGKKYNFSIFKNNYKQKENHPDYNILLNQKQSTPPSGQAAGLTPEYQNANTVNNVINDPWGDAVDQRQADEDIQF